MLVLTRKPQEKIRIGDDIVITVIKTKGQGVRLGIEAPRDVSVLRGELVASADSFAEHGDSRVDASVAAPSDDTDEGVVKFSRTTRSRVASVLPDLLGEPGPLRDLLTDRASTGV